MSGTRVCMQHGIAVFPFSLDTRIGNMLAYGRNGIFHFNGYFVSYETNVENKTSFTQFPFVPLHIEIFI